MRIKIPILAIAVLLSFGTTACKNKSSDTGDTAATDSGSGNDTGKDSGNDSGSDSAYGS